MTVCYFVIVIGAFFTGMNIGDTLCTAATLLINMSIFDVVMLHPSMSTPTTSAFYYCCSDAYLPSLQFLTHNVLYEFCYL